MKRLRPLLILLLLSLLLTPVVAYAGDTPLSGATNGSRTTPAAPDSQPAPRSVSAPAAGIVFSQGFDDITNLPGWVMQNNSSPVGTALYWFQGNATVFPAHAGATTSYIGVNFNSTTGANTISNWLISPQIMSLNNGDNVSFWTRTADTPTYPDRLQLRLSLAGASTNVGSGAEDVGDFTTLLLDINPTLTTSGYPDVWTEYNATLSGLPANASGRLAWRYYVTNGGPTGSNSDYIGVDTVTYTSVCDPITLSPVSGALPGASIGSSYSQALSQSGGLGVITYTLSAGALPSGLSLASDGLISGDPNFVGTSAFTVTVTADGANTCTSAPTAYSIAVAPQVICGIQSAAEPANYNFFGDVNIVVQNDGADLDCISMAPYAGDHISATQAIETGRYWSFLALQSDNSTPATQDWSLDLTLPTPDFTPTVDSTLCRYNPGGPGYEWDCASSSFNSAIAPYTITRNGVTQFSDWAAGDNAGPTAVSLRSLGLRPNAAVGWPAGLALLLLGLVTLGLRRRLK